MQYLKIRDKIIEQIETGTLQAKQKLPSERQLAQFFNTTRITLREALSLLEAEGKIYREDRRGWFISPMVFHFDPSSTRRFQYQAEEQGRKHDCLWVNKTTELASKEANHLLTLPPFSQVHQLEAIWRLDNSPIAHAMHYLPENQFPTLALDDIARSLDCGFTQEEGISGHTVQFQVSLSCFLAQQAQHMHVTSGSTALVLTQYHLDDNATTKWATVVHWRPEAVCLAA